VDQLDSLERLPVSKPIYASEARPAKPSAVVQDGVSEEAVLELMRTVVDSLQQADEAIAADVMTVVAASERLHAGSCTVHCRKSQAACCSLGVFVGVFWPFAKSRQVMNWSKHGGRLDFVSPFSEAQRKHPKFMSRLLIIEQLLLATVDKCDVPSMLNRTSPAQMQFANRVSCDSNAAFVRDTLQDLVTVGSLAPWQGARPPTVINGLGVAKNGKGKKRLVQDCRYANAFVRYERFACE